MFVAFDDNGHGGEGHWDAATRAMARSPWRRKWRSSAAGRYELLIQYRAVTRPARPSGRVARAYPPRPYRGSRSRASRSVELRRVRIGSVMTFDVSAIRVGLPPGAPLVFLQLTLGAPDPTCHWPLDYRRCHAAATSPAGKIAVIKRYVGLAL